MLFLLFTPLALAGGEAAPTVSQIDAGSVVHQMSLIATNPSKGLVAFKVIAAVAGPDDEEPAVSCSYAGMEKTPYAGVTLGVWDLNAKAVTESWQVYESVHAEEQCTPFADSEARLASAKSRLAALGLDLTAPPASIKVATDGTLSWTHAGEAHTVKVSSLPPRKLYTEAEAEEDAMLDTQYEARFQVTAGDKVVHSQSETFSAMMASSVSISSDQAVVSGDTLVVVERWEYSSMRGSGVSFKLTAVTPPK